MDSREPDGGDGAGSHDRDRPRVDYGSNLAHSQLNEEDIAGLFNLKVILYVWF